MASNMLVPSIKTEMGVEWRRETQPAPTASSSTSVGPRKRLSPQVVKAKTTRLRPNVNNLPEPEPGVNFQRGPNYLLGPHDVWIHEARGADDEVVIARGELDVCVSQSGGQQSAGAMAQLVLRNFLSKGAPPIIDVGPGNDGRKVERLKIFIRPADGEGGQKLPALTQTVPGHGGAQGRESDAAARKRLWLRDLETIRRPEPLVPVSSGVLQATISKIRASKAKADVKNDDGNSKENPKDLTGDSPKGKEPEVIPDADLPSFYGQTGEKMLLFQDRKTHRGKIPAPDDGTVSHRLLMENFRNTFKLPNDIKESETHSTIPTLYDSEKGWPKNHEQAHKAAYQAELTSERGKTKVPLIKGLPLVEEVVFLRIPNYQGEPGECFWKAIAIHIYGDWRYHHRVKGEHFEHFHRVLKEKNHPRHQFYHDINQRFYPSRSSPKYSKAVETAANMYQILCMPCTYAPLHMFDVTADLYNVFLIVYTLNAQNEISFVVTKGSYNSRHLFVLYVNDNHFQPLVPNEFWASEFRLPMITLESTGVYPTLPGVAAANDPKAKDGIGHRWRIETAASKRVGRPMFVDHKESRNGDIISQYGIGVTVEGEEMDLS